MLDLCVAALSGGSLGVVQELQQLLLYLCLHAWLGLFFSLQLASLLLTKGRADAYNACGALRGADARAAAGIARGVLAARGRALRRRWCEVICFVDELILA
jgi:hypothetical protein